MTNFDFFLSKKWRKLEGPCGKSSHLTGVNFQVVWNDNSGETKVGGGRFWANSRSSSNATISFNFSILNKQKYSGGSKIRRPWWDKQLDGKMFRSIIFCWQNYCLFNSNKDFGQHWTPVSVCNFTHKLEYGLFCWDWYSSFLWFFLSYKSLV